MSAPGRAVRLALAVLLAAPLSAAPRAAAAQELGRLFYTPQQRQDMDRRRANSAQAQAAVAAAPTVADLVTVNGQVSRSNGISTTWINGVPQNDIHSGSDASSIAISAAGESASTSLKVGETLDRLKGEKRDGLAGGKVSVRSQTR